MTHRGSQAERADALARSACSGDVRRARALLAAEPELAGFDLYAACATGEVGVVEDVLRRDPDAARRKGGPMGREPILYACFSRLLRCDAERAAGIVRVVRRLLEGGADANAHFFEAGGARFVQTPLFGAAGIANNAELTGMLLAAGADVSELAGPASLSDTTNWGTEALYHASEFADVTCLRLLLEARPDPVRVSYCLGRALDFAGPAAAMLYLAHGADPSFRVPWAGGRTRLHAAVMAGRPTEVVGAMLARRADVNAIDGDGISVYRHAVRHGHDGLAMLLAERGANCSGVTDTDERLGAAARGEAAGGRIEDRLAGDVLCRAAQLGNVAAVTALLDAGVDVEASGGGDGTRPIDWACWRGHLGAARLLVGRGTSLTRVNCYGSEPLGTAIHGSWNCHDVEGGATMRLPEEVPRREYPEVVEMLIDAGAEARSAVYGGSDEVRAVLRRRGVRLGEDEIGVT